MITCVRICDARIPSPTLFSFFFNDTATTEIYTLFPTRRSSDLAAVAMFATQPGLAAISLAPVPFVVAVDRKSTRLNSSHANISYAVFCLKKKQAPLSRHLRLNH